MISIADRAKDAASILNYLDGDLLGAHRSLPLFEEVASSTGVSDKTKMIFKRMYVSYLTLTLAKIAEFYKQYQDLIPEDCIDAFRSLNTEIERLGIRRFRNKFIGHILDLDTGRPFSDSDVEEWFQKVTDRDLDKFLIWINTPGSYEFPKTVVSIVERTRDLILEKYHVQL